jgi:LPPG:FO 2-phospho-L-lactate transferase
MDTVDESEAESIRGAGIAAAARPLLMTDLPASAAIAGAALDLADSLR